MADHYVHPTADVSRQANIDAGTKIWNWVQVRENVKIGKDCVISKGCYIDHDVHIGDQVKIQNNVSLYYKCEIADNVFIGPHVCFTNDRLPRATNPDGVPKTGGTADADWEISTITVKEGASIGANATILPGVTIGAWALVGAGSVVTRDVPDHGLVMGNPARRVGFVCRCARKLTLKEKTKTTAILTCVCGLRHEVSREIYERLK
jgi:UDP-2-acetamido-3-amino-2,3-dideoxy-glucuronate N-acetyltransferase